MLVTFCENDVPDKAVRERAVIEVVAWGAPAASSDLRLLNSGRGIGRSVLMSGLSPVLEGIAKTTQNVQKCAVHCG